MQIQAIAALRVMEEGLRHPGQAGMACEQAAALGVTASRRLQLATKGSAALGLLPDHPSRAFTWRRVRQRVARVNGPERIADEW